MPSFGSEMDDDPELAHRDQPVSLHRFHFWGALGRTCLFLFSAFLALLIGLGCLAGAGAAVERSGVQAALWALFSLCGFISTPMLIYEALRLFIQTPAVIEVYRTGLRWHKGGRESEAAWAEITRVDRQVIVFIRAGREHRDDTTTIHFASGESWRIWAEILTDYATFADSVKYFHANAELGKVRRPAGASQQESKEMRCWHCGALFEVAVNPSEQVRCPHCKAGLGTIRS